MTKILIIRFRRVGDAVISSTLCTSLKKSIPDAEIHYVLNDNIAPLFLDHPDIDKLITFSNHDMSSFSKYLKKVYTLMKDEKYDIIIDTRSTIKTMFFSLFSLKSPFRIGRKKKYNFFIQNYRIDNRYDGTRDNTELTLALLDPLTHKYDIIKDPNFKLYYSEEKFYEYRDYMHSKGINFSKPIIVCAVTARLKHKIWDISKMQVILDKIIHTFDAQLIFNFGDKVEKEECIELQAKMNDDKHIFTNIEANNLLELTYLIGNSNFFFGNEGGPRHISQALGIPSFAIFPPGTEKDNWLPNKSEKYSGIELKDIFKDKTKYEHLEYNQQFNLIDIKSVWNALNKSLTKHIH